MFTSQKIAAVSGIVGSLAAICLGAGHAYADGGSSACKNTAQGGVVCVQKNETRTDKDGEHTLRQEQSCSTADRPHVTVPGDRGSSGTGSVVDCSNKAELPKGFKKPQISF
ncbi:hypothetical protein CW362_17265 [Streptomyces populi]|uniref:Uncharacterized protein n=1 Tax=Streptomyces populi TaxID=2058924 RepID=A0A2I0SPH0_9ACTN|nr:hypothetical protein [Streptomyces populi]PKT71832.1 hypothetical protein CW362_17265 [Streptomyces populi]